MNSPISLLKSPVFLAIAGAAAWIGSATAAPLPVSATQNMGALVATVASDRYRDEDAKLGQFELAPELRRQVVNYSSNVAAGTIVIDTEETYLYYVLGDGTAIRYGIGVGRDGFTWSGAQAVTRKAEWPDWTPPQEMIERQPYLPRWMAGGEGNPLGARAMYLGNTVYRIHGTNMPATIGEKVSSGCIRMLNSDVIDLYSRVDIGTKIIVLPTHATVAALAPPARLAAR
jgi:lipoprotein-anchoring transpeptidase ErfK/SrfK